MRLAGISGLSCVFNQIVNEPSPCLAAIYSSAIPGGSTFPVIFTALAGSVKEILTTQKSLSSKPRK